MIVIDCVTAPSAEAMRAAGVTGLCRYLSWPYRWAGATHTYINPKVIQRAEYDRHITDGFTVALNWEYDARDYRGGAMAGADHANEAVNQARALGYPAGCVIIGSADADVSRTDWLATGRAYYSAFSTKLRLAGYRAGIYGPWDVLTWARDDDVADVFWQAGMSTAWSAGRNAQLWPGAHLRQRRQAFIGGMDCDVNDIIQPDYGQAGGDMGAIDDVKAMESWEDPRVEGMAWLKQPSTGPEKGKDLPFVETIKRIDANAAKATGGQVDPAALAAALTADQLAAIGTAMGAEMARRLGNG